MTGRNPWMSGSTVLSNSRWSSPESLGEYVHYEVDTFGPLLFPWDILLRFVSLQIIRGVILCVVVIIYERLIGFKGRPREVVLGLRRIWLFPTLLMLSVACIVNSIAM